MIKQYIAAKAIIKNKSGKILVLKQSSEKEVDGYEMYHPPGGVIEIGESIEEALVREVNEEIGRGCIVGELLDAKEWNVNIRGDQCCFIGLFYLCTIEGEEDGFHLEEEEASEYKWIDMDDLQSVSVLEPSSSVIKGAL